MQKETSCEFEGKTAYSNIDVKFGVGPKNARSVLRALTRAVIDSNKELGLDCLQSIVQEHENALQEYADSQE